MILFGSRARGEARRKSDYDVAVFMRGSADPSPVDPTLLEIAYRFLLKGLYISPIALSDRLLNVPSASPLMVSIARDGIQVR